MYSYCKFNVLFSTHLITKQTLVKVTRSMGNNPAASFEMLLFPCLALSTCLYPHKRLQWCIDCRCYQTHAGMSDSALSQEELLYVSAETMVQRLNPYDLWPGGEALRSSRLSLLISPVHTVCLCVCVCVFVCRCLFISTNAHVVLLCPACVVLKALSCHGKSLDCSW